MRRWTRRILLGLLILIILVVIGAQLALWSDYPRKIVLAEVQKNIGLRIQAASMETGWLGGTVLRDVKVSLPLGKEAFLEMPEMTLSHTALLPLAVTRSFDLKSVLLSKPTLIVRRDATGRWNFQDVIELIDKATTKTPEPGSKKRPPPLPKLRVTDGTVTVIEKNGQKAIISNVAAEGDPDGPLVYRYDVEVPQRLKIVGELAPGENWKHQASVFADPKDWLIPWMPDTPTPLVINAKWSGIVDKGTLHGRLMLEEGKYKAFTANGRVLVDASSAETVVSPQGFVINTPFAQAPQIKLEAGAVQIDGTKLNARQLRIAAVGGDAFIDGTADLAANSAELNAVWQDLVVPGSDIRHSGNLAIELKTPFPGRPVITSTLISRGSLPEGQWDGELRIEGAGRSWDDIDWNARMQRGSWSGKLPLAAENFTARVTQRGPVFTLTEVNWPQHQVFANGRIDFRDRTWQARLQGSEAMQTTVSFNLDVRGDRERVLLKELVLRANDAELKADGSYTMSVPKPVDLRVYLSHLPRNGTSDDDFVLRGACMAEGNISGTMWPRDLEAKGSLRARDLKIFGRTYGDVRGDVVGKINPDNADFTVSDLKLLGGRWQINGVWPYQGKDKLIEGEPLRVRVVANKLAMKDVAELLNAPPATGEAGGEWVIDLPFPRPRRDAVVVQGKFVAKQIVANGLQIDELNGQTSLQNGVFRADPIVATRKDREVNGSATASVQTTLALPKHPTVKLTSQTWPLRFGADGIAAVTLNTTLAIDADAKGVTGPISARASIATTKRAIGEAAIEGHVEGRVATLEKIDLNGAGGTAQGQATVDFDKPSQALATLNWDQIDGERIADLVPQLAGLKGKYSGEASLHPATAERALEPLRLTVGITPADGKFRELAIGSMKLSAFLKLRNDFVVERIVLDELPSEHRESEKREAELTARGLSPFERPLEWNDLRLAGGRMRLWGRRNEHQSGGVQTHVIADFSQLDVEQIVHAITPNDKPVPGRASGRIVLHGDPQQRDLLFGEGHVDLTDSDLANIKAFAFLYDALHIGFAPKKPIGYGSLDLSLQASTLSVQSLRYFNRGAEARADSIDIADVWNFEKGPLSGYLVGTARPLAGIKLPLVADVDQILNVVQSGLTTVKIAGTVKDPKLSIGALSEAGEGLRQLIAGDVRATKK